MVFGFCWMSRSSVGFLGEEGDFNRGCSIGKGFEVGNGLSGVLFICYI